MPAIYETVSHHHGILKDETGGKINWQYITELHKVQESEEQQTYCSPFKLAKK